MTGPRVGIADDAHPTPAQIVVERVGQPQGLVFPKIPSGVSPADVVGHVPGEEGMLLPLDLLCAVLQAKFPE